MSGFCEYSSSGIRKRPLWQGAIGAEAQIVEIDAGSEFKTLVILLPNSKTRTLTLRNAEFAGELKNQFTR
jgi:hypothetical protein